MNTYAPAPSLNRPSLSTRIRTSAKGKGRNSAGLYIASFSKKKTKKQKLPNDHYVKLSIKFPAVM